MKDFMHQYVRDKNNNPVGLMIAKKVNEFVFITGSRVNIKAGDKFDKVIAMNIAKGRMECLIEGDGAVNTIAENMRHDMIKFTNRVCRYFQIHDENCVVTPRVKRGVRQHEIDTEPLWNPT